jgi:hypothetical protein
MKALLIDSAARDIREVEYAGLADLQKFVGGYIEIAFSWRTDDVLFVDEEGLFKPQRHFFRIAGRGDQPLAGNGVVVGKERYDGEGNYLSTNDPRITVDELREQVTFRSRDQVDAWAKANASEPSASITTFDKDGEPVTRVIGHYGELFGAMPRPDDEGAEEDV